MGSDYLVSCDGCGRTANQHHVARRLQRLEWSTRFRPIHIQRLFLGLAAPMTEEEYLYSPAGMVRGEAAMILEALGLPGDGRDREIVLAEAQRKGAFLAHLLDCPADAGESEATVTELTDKRLPQVLVRIRKSIKPQKLVVLPGVTDGAWRALINAGLSIPVERYSSGS